MVLICLKSAIFCKLILKMGTFCMFSEIFGFVEKCQSYANFRKSLIFKNPQFSHIMYSILVEFVQIRLLRTLILSSFGISMLKVMDCYVVWVLSFNIETIGSKVMPLLNFLLTSKTENLLKSSNKQPKFADFSISPIFCLFLV